MEEQKKYYDYTIKVFSLDDTYKRNRYLDNITYSGSEPAEILEIKVTEKGIFIVYRFEYTEENYRNKQKWI